MKRTGQFLINTVILTAVSLLINTAGMFFNVYLSNRLGAQAMGVMQLIMSVYNFGITLAISGVGLAATRVVSEELAVGNELGAKIAIRKCLLISTGYGCLAGGLLFLGAPLIGEHLLKNTRTVVPLVILAVSLPFTALFSSLNGYFMAVRRVFKSSTSYIFEQFIKITLTVYLLTFFASDNIEKACIAVVMGGTVSEIASFFYLYALYLFDKRIYQNVKKGNDITNRIFSVSLPVSLSSYLRSALSSLKHIITPLRLQMSGVSTEQALAQYGLIHGMAMPVLFFPATFLNAFSSNLVPELARFQVRGETAKISKIVAKIFKFGLIFSIAVSVGIFFFAEKLSLSLYHSTEVSGYLRLLSPLVIVIYFDNVVDGILKGLNMQTSIVRINIIDTAVTVTLIYFLLPIYGIKGYIAVIFVSEVLNAALSILKLAQVVNFKINVIEWLLIPFVGIMTALLLTKLFNASSLVLDIGLSAMIYVIVLYIAGVIEKNPLSLAA